eukprot:TRINITY_DN9586_c0_g3_i2.p1 TRINITY_DN9586_c0_g3~~TRINITY_DN9586_c0_g3_i2.p1  ORF type:complete len:220 (+),score=38.27 TRINITY_DN9586_c0_g3_i2:92-751(+)
MNSNVADEPKERRNERDVARERKRDLRQMQQSVSLSHDKPTLEEEKKERRRRRVGPMKEEPKGSLHFEGSRRRQLFSRAAQIFDRADEYLTKHRMRILDSLGKIEEVARRHPLLSDSDAKRQELPAGQPLQPAQKEANRQSTPPAKPSENEAADKKGEDGLWYRLRPGSRQNVIRKTTCLSDELDRLNNLYSRNRFAIDEFVTLRKSLLALNALSPLRR